MDKEVAAGVGTGAQGRPTECDRSQLGADVFKLMAESARDQGFITQRGLENLMDVFHRGDLR